MCNHWYLQYANHRAGVINWLIKWYCKFFWLSIDIDYANYSKRHTLEAATADNVQYRGYRNTFQSSNGRCSCINSFIWSNYSHWFEVSDNQFQNLSHSQPAFHSMKPRIIVREWGIYSDYTSRYANHKKLNTIYMFCYYYYSTLHQYYTDFIQEGF